MSIYKDCDIRGIFGKEFDETEGYRIGRAVGSLHKNARLAVAGDVRHSTLVLKEELVRGLREEGVHVVDLDIVATPMFYYALDRLEVQGGIMVTASHNPPQYNGFKLMFGESPITGGEIREIERLVREQEEGRQQENAVSLPCREETPACPDRGKGPVFQEGVCPGVWGTYEKRDIAEAYGDFIRSFFRPGERRQKLVLDCCDGATSRFYPEIAESLGYEVERLYCGTDGSFPNRNPNPALYTCLEDLARKVLETQADLGAGYDGDGDRVVFVDNKGRVIPSEKSFVVFIRDYLERHRQGETFKDQKGRTLTPSFVYDQKSMGIVKKAIEAGQGTPLIEKSGYGFIKKSFLEHGSMMGGEISGHFFFGEIGKDDGLFATLKMCEILERSGKDFAQWIDEIPPGFVSPELRIFCAYENQDALLAKAEELAREYTCVKLDGVRIEFPSGWFLIRKSVTEEAVTIRMEADSMEYLEWMKETIRKAIPEVEENAYFAVKR